MQVTAQTINEQFASLKATLEASNQSLEESGKTLEDVTAKNAVARQRAAAYATVQQAPVQQVPVQQAPVQQVSVQQAPVQQVQPVQKPVQQVPVQPVQQSVQQPVQQVPLQPVQEPVQPVQEPVYQEPVVQEPVGEEEKETQDYDKDFANAIESIKGLDLATLMQADGGQGLSL